MAGQQNATSFCSESKIRTANEVMKRAMENQTGTGA
jgi:hypothetical protein